MAASAVNLDSETLSIVVTEGGNRQQIVRIVRINPTQAADAQPASATGGSPS